MQTQHSILLVGPYDWDPELMPAGEFQERIKAFWNAMGDPSCGGAIVYGDSRHHAELAYLTGFTPKVRLAMAFLPRQGEAAVLVPGSKVGLSSARKLTWVKNVELLSDPGKAVAQWIKDLSAPRLALLGGEHIREPMYGEIVQAAGSEDRLADATAALAPLMRRKRPRELAAIRKACEMLKASADTLRKAQLSGASATGVALEAEHAASALGAQDVQVLFSLDGGRTLRPFNGPVDKAIDPLQAYITVSHAGYWADGLVSVSPSPHAVHRKAGEALKAMLASAGAGAKSRELARKAKEALGSCRLHPMTEASIGSSIGLTLDEAPSLGVEGDAALQAGSVYSLRVGATDGENHALVSAMIAVGDAGCEVLWSAA
jgi:Xaa-Pro aminopeptidase